MGKGDNRRTFKMKRRKAQSAKKAREKARILLSRSAKKTTKR